MRSDPSHHMEGLQCSLVVQMILNKGSSIVGLLLTVILLVTVGHLLLSDYQADHGTDSDQALEARLQQLRDSLDHDEPKISRLSPSEERYLRLVDQVAQRLHNQSQDRIIYNRVPKCASSTMVSLLQMLKHTNKFTFQHSTVYDKFRLSNEEQRDFVGWFQHLQPPVVFDRHLLYTQFSRHGAAEPVHINIIRDPLDRKVSAYYFNRLYLRHMIKMSEDRRRMSFDRCVEIDDEECIGPTLKGSFAIIPMFCGHEDFCQVPGKASLERAIENINNNYLVVGILEDIPGYLEILEYFLPKFFSKAQPMFKKMDSISKKAFKTKGKSKPSNGTVVKMKSIMKEEYAFYNFVKRRFNNLLQGVRLKKKFGLQLH